MHYEGAKDEGRRIERWSRDRKAWWKRKGTNDATAWHAWKGTEWPLMIRDERNGFDARDIRQDGAKTMKSSALTTVSRSAVESSRINHFSWRMS
jgi:hypothetical protein